MPLKHQITKTHKKRINKLILVKSCLRQAGWCFCVLVAGKQFLKKINVFCKNFRLIATLENFSCQS